MAFIELISETDAPDEAAQLLAADRAARGYPANFTRAFAHRPAVYAAWRQLVGAITATIDPRLYELATLAAARGLRSSYCSLAHGKVLAEQFLPAETVLELARDPRSVELEPLEAAVMELAAKVVDDATSVTGADIDRLRELGLSDAEIFDVVAAAAARCFFSKTLDALGVQADSAFQSMEPQLRDTLAAGRPIAEE